MKKNGETHQKNDKTTQEELLWVKRLRWCYPKQTREIEDSKLLELVQTALPFCEPLQITDENDILRFLALSFLITPEQKQSHLIEGTVRRTLSNLDWDSKKRLNFIYKHVIGRPVSPNEMNWGEFFVPKVQ